MSTKNKIEGPATPTPRDYYGTLEGKRRNYYVDSVNDSKAKMIGDGNASLGIRKALEAYRLPKKP